MSRFPERERFEDKIRGSVDRACGMNMSLNAVLLRLEQVVGIPIIGVNAAIFWHAVRESRFEMPLNGAADWCESSICRRWALALQISAPFRAEGGI